MPILAHMLRFNSRRICSASSCSWRASSIRLWTLLALCTAGDGITLRSQILGQILFHLGCCFEGHRI